MKTSEKLSFPQKIEALKVKRGLKTDKELAQNIGVGETRLNAIKNAKRVPEIWQLRIDRMLSESVVASIPLDESDKRLFDKWATRARMPLEKFVVDCVKACGKGFAIEREKDMDETPKPSLEPPDDAAPSLKKLDDAAEKSAGQ